MANRVKDLKSKPKGKYPCTPDQKKQLWLIKGKRRRKSI